jgi:hypothetical protein
MVLTVFVEYTGRKVTLRDEFLGFVRASETTCEKDGAANMSGIHALAIFHVPFRR